ncbi:MAG: Ig-like domain-containing protein [Candidatus Hydrogenedentes bacterium]|nr:Ig-like domain-containing protein [Candidatus Hydrogenedentota bacterium]
MKSIRTIATGLSAVALFLGQGWAQADTGEFRWAAGPGSLPLGWNTLVDGQILDEDLGDGTYHVNVSPTVGGTNFVVLQNDQGQAIQFDDTQDWELNAEWTVPDASTQQGGVSEGPDVPAASTESTSNTYCYIGTEANTTVDGGKLRYGIEWPSTAPVAGRQWVVRGQSFSAGAGGAPSESPNDESTWVAGDDAGDAWTDGKVVTTIKIRQVWNATTREITTYYGVNGDEPARAFQLVGNGGTALPVDQAVAGATNPDIFTIKARGLATLELGPIVITGTALNQVAPELPSGVTVQAAEESVLIGDTLQLFAIDSEDTEATFTWSSADDAIATVDGNGLVTGVSAGTVAIEAESSGGGTGSLEIEVRAPEWFDICSFDDTLQAQLAAAAGALGGADADADGIPDTFQIALLSYALCEGGVEGKTVDKATVLEEFNGNLAILEDLATDVAAVEEAWEGIAFIINFFNNNFAINGGATQVNAVNNVLQAALDLQDAPEISAALLGLSTQMQAAVSGAFDGVAEIDTIYTPTAAADISTANAATWNFIESQLPGFGGTFLADFQADRAAILSQQITINPLNLTIYGTGGPAKDGDEPFAGDGDYNEDGLDNLGAYNAVIAQGGGQPEFIVAASGDFGPFWEGNPLLPVTGLFGAGVLMSALGAAGAMTLRKRSKN